MKIFALFIIFLFIGWWVLYLKEKNDESEVVFFNRKHSELIKGYAIIFVILAHVGQYLGINGIEYPGGVGVSLFLIASGYGCAKSEQINSLSDFWKKRFHKIWIPYFIVELLRVFITHTVYPIKIFWLDITLIKPMHPFGWYLRFIVVCYFIFYFTGRIFKNDKLRLGSLVILFIIWFLIRSMIWIDTTPFLQARQILAFPLGVYIANSCDKNVQKCRGGGQWNSIWSICLIMIGTCIYGFLHLGIITTERLLLYNIIALFTCTICALGFIIMIVDVRFLQNRGLKFVASISYELYLVHGYTCGLIEQKTVFSLGEFICLTILGSVILHYVTIILNKRLRVI